MLVCFYSQAVPVSSADQMILVDIISAIKLLSLESVMQTVRLIIKQPPQQSSLSAGGSVVCTILDINNM